MKLTQIVDLAYLAGIIDGEGCITFIKHKHEHNSRGYIYEPKLEITNTNEDLINRCLKCMPKQATKVYQDDKRKDYYKRCWSIRLQQYDSLLSFLKQIQPYLVAKQKQADMMIQYLESKITRRYGKYTAKDIELAESIRKLNKRGI